MTIYVIAAVRRSGPPGIGKSTNAGDFIPTGVPIIDQDLAGYQYKKRGFADYQDLASLSTNQRIKEHLFAGEDFALELNLGFPSHYAYLKSIAYFDRNNVVHLILFFTDDLNLCIDRARIRYLSGGHEVRPAIIGEMYASTLPLFAENQAMFQSVRLIDVTDRMITEYARTNDRLPAWIVNNGLEMYVLN